MANPFDQFDEQTTPTGNTGGGNPFDQFDEAPAPVATDEGLADTGMYSGAQTGEEAFDTYLKAKEDPRNDNRFVPPPSYNLGRHVPLVGETLFGDEPYVVDPKDKAIGWGLNAAKSTAKTVAGIGGEIMEGAASLVGIDYDNKGAEFIDENMPEMVTEGEFDRVTNEIATAAIGGLGGAAATAKGVTAASNAAREALKGSYRAVPALIKYLGTEASAAAGAAATMDEDTDTLLVGPGKIISGATPEGDFNDELLAKKYNVMVDAMLLGGAAVGGTKAVGKGMGFLNEQILKPIKGLFNPTRSETQMFELMLKQTEGIENMSPDEVVTATKKIAKLIEENKDVVFKGGGKEVELELDPLAALERGLRNAGDNAGAARVKAQRDAIFKSGYGDTITKSTEYTDKTNEFADNVYAGGGGREGVESARKGIVDSAEAEIAPYEDAVGDLATQLDAAKTNIEQTLKDDPTFGAKLQKLGDQSGININATTNKSIDTLVDRVRQAHDKMSTKRRELYEAIPAGTPIDSDGLARELVELKGTSAEGALPKALRDILKGDEDEIAESLSEIDYTTLHNSIVPDLSRQISRRMTAGNSSEAMDAADALIGLRNHIKKDQFAYQQQLGRGNKPLLRAVERAQEFEKTYQSFFSSGPLAKISNLESKIVPGNVGDEREFMDKAGKVVEGAFTNANRHTADTFIEFLNYPGNRKSAPLVADFIIGKAARDLSDTVRTKGIGEVNFDQFGQTLRDEAAVLYKNFPKEAKRIDAFVQNLRSQQKSIPELEASLKEAEKVAKIARDEIINKELNRFFDNLQRPIADAQDIFNDIFSSTKSSNDLQSLMARANQSENPEIVRDGLQAAYGKYLDFNPTFVQNNQEKLIDYAEIIFPDKPEVVEATKKAFQVIEDTTIGKAPENMVGRVPRQVLVEGTDSIGKVITWTFGILSRAGAMTRGGASTIVKSVDPVERTTQILGKMYTDPDEFFRIGQSYLDNLGRPGQEQRVAEDMVRFLTVGTNPMGEASEPPLPTDDLEATSEAPTEPTGGTLEPTGTELPEAPRLPPVDDLEEIQRKEQARTPLTESGRSRSSGGFVATYEF